VYSVRLTKLFLDKAERLYVLPGTLNLDIGNNISCLLDNESDSGFADGIIVGSGLFFFVIQVVRVGFKQLKEDILGCFENFGVNEAARECCVIWLDAVHFHQVEPQL